MPAFFLSDAIAIPEIFRSFIWEKFFCLIPPKAIKLVEKPRETKLNFILPKKLKLNNKLIEKGINKQ